MNNSMPLAVMLLLTSCSCPGPETKRTPIIERDTFLIHDTVHVIHQSTSWQRNFGLTHDPDRDSVWGKPVRYYLEDSTLSRAAIDFYFGRFRPDDGGATHELLSHVYTDNDRLRPFYRWCLSRTIQIQDGGLSELTGEPARRYVEKFSKEFIEYIDHDTTGERALQWAGAIGYSGIRDGEDWKDAPRLRKNLLKAMKASCTGCDAGVIAKVEGFVRQCFHDYAPVPDTTRSKPTVSR